MNRILLSLFFVFIFQLSFGQTQTINENFETSPTVNSWEVDDCVMDTNFANPYNNETNPSNAVLKYDDTGGTYANIRFTTAANFDLSVNNNFSFKIYVSSSDITGSQNNQVALKLQNGNLGGSAWTTQTEIIKTITLDTWQTVTFDFESDAYVNYPEGETRNPKDRTDFNRVVIQVNGENNQDKVVAYIDDFTYDGTIKVEQSTEFNNLVWSDEFDGNGAVNSDNWFHQVIPIKGDSWANNEKQHYTARTDNSYVSNETLKIVARKENYTYNGAQKEYTSARLNSKFSFKYGRVEVRAKLPSKAGSWPAIWLLGKNINEVGTFYADTGNTPWPFCGEIDIMEPNIEKTEILGTWHWANAEGNHTYNSKGIATNNADTSQNFHIYSLVWDETSMKIYMDNTLINESGSFDPFNQEFFILLNVAMGGDLGGTIDSNYTEDTMEIDYVRVYQEAPLSVSDNLQLEKATLYPNPVDEQLIIEVPSHLIGAKVTIYSVLGQEIDSFIQKTQRFEKNISDYKRGVYFVRFETASRSEKYSIIKK